MLSVMALDRQVRFKLTVQVHLPEQSSSWPYQALDATPASFTTPEVY